MRLPCPNAPEMTATGVLWAVALSIALFFLTIAVAILWQPGAIILWGIFGACACYLMGAEMWNGRQRD